MEEKEQEKAFIPYYKPYYHDTDNCPYCSHEYGSFYKNNKNQLIERIKTKDHIIPLSKGGNKYINNIIICCSRCNAFKGDLTIEEWMNMINFALENSTNSGVKVVKGQSGDLRNYKKKELITLSDNLKKIDLKPIKFFL